MERISDRTELARRLPGGGIEAELGVCAGGYARVLLREAWPKRLYLIDLWQADVMGYTATEARQRAFAAFEGEEAVRLVVSDTVAWLAARRPSSLDWCYIDSDHSEPLTTRELCQSLRVVKAGGWICGHDYGPFSPGVVNAVNRFCELHGQRLTYLTDEPEAPPRKAAPWMPSRAACNSFAIVVEK
ncbi:MAG TPA: class I SAM-dependent methyltransferase [Pirellulaceae bacterium]|nr:class I SAM-dependent methyltransferase [Pirellulaceae bacterium]